MSMQLHTRIMEERLRRGWSKQYLADLLGVTRMTITRWEAGKTHPPRYYHQKISEVFGLSAQQLGLEPVASMLPPAQEAQSSIFDPAIPLPLPERLIGRNELLATLRTQLMGAHAFSALCGLPGVGKTALVVALVYDPDMRQRFEGILWAGLGPQPSVEEHFSRWSLLLGLNQPERSTCKAWAQALHAAIGERRFLLVLDDAWSLDDALAMQVGGPTCAYLLTTRNPTVAAAFAPETTTVPALDEEDGLQLLTRQAGLGWLQQAARGDQAAELADALHLLVRLVGGLPLALTLMGTWLRVQAHSGQVRRIRQAIELLSGDARRRLRLAWPQAVLEQHPSLSPGAALSLEQVIGVSFDLLTKAARAALLALAVFPAKPNSFSEATALAVASCTIQTLDALLDTGLIEATGEIAGEERYNLHQTIADYARSQLSPEEHRAAQVRLVTYYLDFAQHLEDSASLEATVREYPFIVVAIQAAFDLDLYPQSLQLLLHFLKRLQNLYLSFDLESSLQQAARVARAKGDAQMLAQVLLPLGKILYNIGRAPEAYWPLLEEGLALVRQHGERELAAQFLMVMGKATRYFAPAKALELLQEAQELAEETGAHILLAGIFHQLSTIAMDQGDFARAERSLEEGFRALEQAGESAQESHEAQEYRLALLTGFGTLCALRGDSGRAIRCWQQALALARQMGFEDSVTSLLLNLGIEETKVGNLTPARDYLLEAEQILDRSGEKSRADVVLQFNLGHLAAKMGGEVEAERRYLQGIAAARQLGRPLNLAEALLEYANYLVQRGDFAQAADVYRGALDVLPESYLLFRAQILFGQARAQAGLGNAEQARMLGEESLALTRSMPASELQAEIERWLTLSKETTKRGGDRPVY